MRLRSAIAAGSVRRDWSCVAAKVTVVDNRAAIVANETASRAAPASSTMDSIHVSRNGVEGEGDARRWNLSLRLHDLHRGDRSGQGDHLPLYRLPGVEQLGVPHGGAGRERQLPVAERPADDLHQNRRKR